MVALKTVLFTLLVPGTVVVLAPFLLLQLQLLPLPLGIGSYLGWVFLLLGIGVYAWCAWDFTFVGKGTPSPDDPPRALVVTGLYRYSRNPMYVGVLLVLLGEVFLFQSGVLLIYMLVVFIGFHLRVLFYEEPVLRQSFSGDFEAYCRRVRRWW